MTLSLVMILILLAILVFGIGFYGWAQASPKTKAWVVFGCFVLATLVFLYYAGVLRVR